MGRTGVAKRYRTSVTYRKNPIILMLYPINRRAAICSLAVAGLALALPLRPAQSQTPPKPNPQMKAVLNELAALGPKPIAKLRPTEARKQPGAADAVKSLLRKKNGGVLPPPEAVGKVEDRTAPGPGGSVPVRVYTPEGNGPFPVLVYVHGGGWVIASVAAYDSSARALCNAAKCVVVSVGYRYAPENPFPAAHEDVYAVTQYVLKNADQFGGDGRKVAIAGESAGGNMATAVCLMARDRKGRMPIHQLLVYPVTDVPVPSRASYQRNKNAVPLNQDAMYWFFQHTLDKPQDAASKYLAVVRNPNLKGLPPATIVAAEIDPLMTEGMDYATRLREAGVPVRYRLYKGVTHEFFGMGAVVDEAKDAVSFSAAGLTKAFNNAK